MTCKDPGGVSEDNKETSIPDLAFWKGDYLKFKGTRPNSK
jgi:hypothetical protein